MQEAAAFNNPRKALETELGLETQYTYAGFVFGFGVGFDGQPKAREVPAPRALRACGAMSAPADLRSVRSWFRVSLPWLTSAYDPTRIVPPPMILRAGFIYFYFCRADPTDLELAFELLSILIVRYRLNRSDEILDGALSPPHLPFFWWRGFVGGGSLGGCGGGGKEG